MDPLQDKLLAPLDRVLDKVRPLGQDDMVPHQDRLQAVGQVSPLAMVNKVQDHVTHLPKAEAGLPQGSLLHLNGMDLAQENLLALVKVDLGKVDLLVVDNRVRSLDRHQVEVSINLAPGMDLAQDSFPSLDSRALITVILPVLAHITQGQASLLPPSGVTVLVQNSLLVWVIMVPHQDKLLAPLDRVLDKVRPLGQDDVAPHQDRLQAVGQVSPLAMVNKVQDHVTHLPKAEAGLPQGSLHVPNAMFQAQESLLALVSIGLVKARPLTVGNVVLFLDNHLVIFNMDLVLVKLKAHFSHLTVDSRVLLHTNLLVLTSKGLDYISLFPVVIMSPPLKSILALDHVCLVQENVLALVTKYLDQVSLLMSIMNLIEINLLAIDNIILHQDSHTAVVSVDLIQTNPLATENRDLVQISLLSMANIDVPQVITLARANMELGVVMVLTLVNMGLVPIPLLTPDKTVQDLVYALLQNNMGLVHVSPLVLDHVVLDMVNILTLNNLSQIGDAETSGNLAVAPQIVMKINQ